RAGYSSPAPTETLSFFDVSTPLASLQATGSGQTAIYNDLGTGATFASRTVSTADNGTLVSVGLNAAGLAAIQAAAGSSVALGGALTSISGTANQFVFGFTGGGTDVKQLVLNLGLPEDWYSINVADLNHAFRIETGTPAAGPGEFVNTLNPKIELYDPSDVLVASGTVGPDGKNEFIQYTPLVTGLYRVRVVGEGNTSGEYLLTNNFTPVVSLDPVASPID